MLIENMNKSLTKPEMIIFDYGHTLLMNQIIVKQMLIKQFISMLRKIPIIYLLMNLTGQLMRYLKKFRKNQEMILKLMNDLFCNWLMNIWE